jgi:uncharacterized protein (TIGR03083 family)
MTDDRDLQGVDPYDAMDRESDRLHRFLTTIDDSAWSRPTRCAGWSVRDLLGHLRASEDYNQASLDGRVQDLLVQLGERGATDLDSANALGIADYADVPTAALIEDWRTVQADTRKRLRDRDGGVVDSTVGDYSARWQACHLAAELATHADDMALPETPEEAPARTQWRAAVSRFLIKEAKPDVEVQSDGGTTRYDAGEQSGTMSDSDFVELVMARDPRDAKISPEVRAALSMM